MYFLDGHNLWSQLKVVAVCIHLSVMVFPHWQYFQSCVYSILEQGGMPAATMAAWHTASKSHTNSILGRLWSVNGLSTLQVPVIAVRGIAIIRQHWDNWNSGGNGMAQHIIEALHNYKFAAICCAVLAVR